MSAREKAYTRWRNMVQRCENPTNKAYKNYGGRGITVCVAWHDFNVYYADVGDAPEGMTLDRIDNDGNYEPGNVRWADRTTQAMNTRPRPRATRCQEGHPYTADSTMWGVSGDGYPTRRCRICHNANARAYKAARRAAERAA